MEMREGGKGKGRPRSPHSKCMIILFKIIPHPPPHYPTLERRRRKGRRAEGRTEKNSSPATHPRYRVSHVPTCGVLAKMILDKIRSIFPFSTSNAIGGRSAAFKSLSNGGQSGCDSELSAPVPLQGGGERESSLSSLPPICKQRRDSQHSLADYAVHCGPSPARV